MNNSIFSGRTESYAKFRTEYPQSLRNFLAADIPIKKESVIADMGSGTGLLARILLEMGAKVFGVEPNDEMRKKAEDNLAEFNNFFSIAGSAEHSGLHERSIDIITAGNAFHWFNIAEAAKEFSRILKYQGQILLIRTDWKEYPAEQMQEYDRIVCKYCRGRSGLVSDISLEKEAIHNFFGSYEIKILGPSHVEYSDDQLKGRFLSTSFAPVHGHADHEAAMKELDELFRKFEKNRKFLFSVITTVVYGTL